MKTMAWMMAVMMGMSVGAVAGTGSVDDPYTIAQARALPVGTTEYWAQGYIVGGRYDDFEAPWANDFAVSCADADSETVFANCLQVVLLNDGGRAAWGLSSNPGNVGKLIKFKGYRDAYGTHPAFKPVNNADISEVILEDQPPVIAAIGNKMVIEGNTLSFTVTATDAVDGDQIALIATSLPAGATFTGATNAGMATGTFTWENAGSLGDYSATFQATDKDGSDTETVSITVHDGSGPLAIAFQGFEGTANDTWTMTDVDPSLVLNTTGAGDLPANQRVRTGSYSWQPGEGEYTTEALELAEVDISAWSEVVLTLHVSATTSEPGDGFGMYPTESLSVFLALDGGDYPGEADITVTGNELEVGEISGALWGFGATGVASTTAGVSRTVAPASGGVAADGIATVRIAIPAGTTSVKLKAEVAQEYAGYFWNVDDIELVGVNDGGASDYPPSLSLSPDGASKSVRVGQSLSFDVTATQIPNDASDEIRLWATGLPSGATFPEVTGTSPLSGTFNWTPAEAASAAVSFFAGDKDGTNQVDVSITAYELPESGAHYGVFVGLNKYSSSYIGSSGWLNGCVPDANHIYTNTTQRGDWTAATVTRLLDGAGTKAAIRRSITNYAAEAVAGDTFFYYHSSHGGQNSGTSVYLCAFDNDYQDTELAADLQKFATGVKVVVMVDACHSGGLFKSARAGTRAVRPPSGTWDLAGIVSRIMDETRAERLAAGMRDVETRVSSSEIGWVTAADYDQYSWDGDDGGAFTDAVIYGWDSGFCDNATYGNQDGYANFYELWNYAKDIAIGYPGEFDPYDGSSYETDAQAHNTNVLLATLAGWVGDSAPGGLVVFNNMTPQGVTVGEELVVPVSAYTAGTSTPVTVTMTTVQAGASYAGGQLTFTPAADGIYVFNFTGTNTLGASANASLTVTATLAAPALSAPTGIGNERFTANWEAVAGAASYRLDVATADTFSPGGTGESGVIVDTPNAVLNEGWAYVNGAEMGSSGVNAYHKLVSASDPGVVSAAFSTMSYLEAAAEFSVATYGGTSANQLVVSYSLDGGSTWIPFGTNTSASSTTYVTGLTIPLPAAALNQPSVRVKWHCPVSTASVGLRLRALVVSGAQAAGGNTLVLSGQSVAGTSHQVTGLEMDTTYYYRVKAVGNSSGPLSATGTATTTAEDTAPSFAAIPAQSATRGAPFTLNVGAYASGYPVPAISVVSSTADAGDYSMAAGSLTFTPSETGEFEFVFSALNDLGSASATTTVAVTEAPVLIPTVSIADLDSDSFTVNWNAVTDATDYQVQVATDDEFSSGGDPGGANRMVNPGFETGDNTGWIKFEAEYAVVTTDPQEGIYHAACTATATRDLMQVVNIEGDGVTEYEVSFWYKKPLTNGNARIWATWATGGQASGDNLTPTNYLPAVEQWTKQTYHVVPQSGANSLNFEVRTYNGATVYWDNFFVGVAGSRSRSEGSILVDETVAALTYPVTGLDPETPYWVRVRSADGDWSEVVSATTLAEGGPPPTPDVAGFAVTAGSTASATLAQSAVGTTYVLQYTTDLLAVPILWTDVDTEEGTGGEVTLEDDNLSDDMRFYRVIVQ